MKFEFFQLQVDDSRRGIRKRPMQFARTFRTIRQTVDNTAFPLVADYLHRDFHIAVSIERIFLFIHIFHL